MTSLPLRFFILLVLLVLTLSLHYFFQSNTSLFLQQAHQTQQQLTQITLDLEKLKTIHPEQASQLRDTQPTLFLHELTNFLAGEEADHVKLNRLKQSQFEDKKWRINYQIATYSLQFHLPVHIAVDELLEKMRKTFPNIQSFNRIKIEEKNITLKDTHKPRRTLQQILSFELDTIEIL